MLAPVGFMKVFQEDLAGMDLDRVVLAASFFSPQHPQWQSTISTPCASPSRQAKQV
jgi:hypothetical protein